MRSDTAKRLNLALWEFILTLAVFGSFASIPVLLINLSEGYAGTREQKEIQVIMAPAPAPVAAPIPAPAPIANDAAQNALVLALNNQSAVLAQALTIIAGQQTALAQATSQAAVPRLPNTRIPEAMRIGNAAAPVATAATAAVPQGAAVYPEERLNGGYFRGNSTRRKRSKLRKTIY